jgi:hypothetical protein
MCWLPLVLGIGMVSIGVALIVRFFVARGAARVEVASVVRTEWMVLGAILVSIGFLLISLGASGVFCGL